MKNYRLDHIHLICPDIERTRQWYCDVLEAEVTFSGRLEGNQVYYLKLTDFTLILIEKLPGEEPLEAALETRNGLDHFGLVVNDMDAAAAELKARGVPFWMEVSAIRPGLRIAYIEAPDKVRIELLERS
jgi:lactoylglutathione lyase